MIDFTMPSLGADMEDGFLREWRVKPGDKIKRGDIIAEVETQKGIIEIEIFEDGTIGELLIKVDEKVPVGTVMARIISEKETQKDKVVPKNISQKTEVPVELQVAEKTSGILKKVHIRASPLAKKIAEEKGIDISTIKGTGPDGAITKDDVENFIHFQTTTTPDKAEQKSKNVSENIRLAVAAAMSRSNREIPHYYLETKIDMNASLTWLKDANKKLSVKERLLPAVLLIKAVAKALEEVPELNAWWENGLQRKKDIHIGFVVSLRTGGIVVPAIHNTANKSINELMQSMNDIIPRARALKLRSSELSDSTITITNLGEEGVETVFGVIYPPQVALVGFGKITEQAYAKNGMIGVHPVLTATLAADHRATDGSTGSKFLKAINKHLQQPESL